MFEKIIAQFLAFFRCRWRLIKIRFEREREKKEEERRRKREKREREKIRFYSVGSYGKR